MLTPFDPVGFSLHGTHHQTAQAITPPFKDVSRQAASSPVQEAWALPSFRRRRNLQSLYDSEDLKQRISALSVTSLEALVTSIERIRGKCRHRAKRCLRLFPCCLPCEPRYQLLLLLEHIVVFRFWQESLQSPVSSPNSLMNRLVAFLHKAAQSNSCSL